MNDMQMIKEIEKIKKEKNIKIFAHNYQNLEVQRVADYLGDSFYLSKLAGEVDCDEIIFCGVRFMAETAKIMCSDKKVVLPVEDAECPMAHMVKPQEVLAFKKEHPEFKVVSYVNTTTELKAVSDVCVTSSIAEIVINNMDAQNILFIPDMNLADYVSKRVKGKNIISWNGYCPVHDKVRKDEIFAMRKEYSGYEVLVHPECRREVLQEADFVGSTSAIINYAKNSAAPGFIIGTETGVLHTLKAENPKKEYELLSPSLICYNMKKTTLRDVYNAVTGKGGLVIELDKELAENAKRSLDEMVRLACN
ncbi:quinolinate synthase A [Peptoclostridium acidaminophilum DSM 3953]|uniref:Quinolinate synthase n=1 Tax=Peptoclostridium acidaminophilum DSM 3953 TaxID=1286171 RepID=W8U301_PEPAC|nr:quinolinate synthase NadA [Peptoclostridium acidaminophilum]AHM55386.1 quinolinate synthase A [Peptoclostridium acidaminophilum DSM 3953]